MSNSKYELKPIEKKPLSLKISDSIYGYIQMNGLQPGDKLPSEREMSTMLQASRNSVREALRILEDRDLIEVRTGLGVFIKNPYGENSTFSIRLHNCTMEEIQELQSTLDHQAVKNAIERASVVEKKQLLSIASEMVKLSLEGIYSHILDHDFHHILYESGNNSAILQLVVKIREDRFVQQENSENGNDKIWLKTVPHHLQLAEAIMKCNLNSAISIIDEINEYGFQFSRSKRCSNRTM